MTDARNVIVRDLFTKECAQEVYMGKPVRVLVGEEVVGEGVINGTFGKSGKLKVQMKEEIKAEGVEKGTVELRLKVYSKELSKLRNIK